LRAIFEVRRILLGMFCLKWFDQTDQRASTLRFHQQLADQWAGPVTSIGRRNHLICIGGVLSVEGINSFKTLGRTFTQVDGANVFLHEITPGRFNQSHVYLNDPFLYISVRTEITPILTVYVAM
jgi:hypothetical protein